MLATPPLSLYLHIPWCVRKCPYCDFNSHEFEREIPEQEYIKVLLDDFDRDYEECGERDISSVFIGGGTPSLFSAGGFEQILEHLRKHSNLAADIEITMEANPGTAEASKFADFKSIGINRLSLGVQSFDDQSLKILGRIHDGLQSQRAIDIAISAGFDNFNIDLMHGLPKQSVAAALEDLRQGLSFSPTHLSWYQLTIEPNTVFYRRPPALPQEDTLRDIQLSGEKLLEENGMEQYEVSAFAKLNRHSRHNLNYWNFGDYIGIGAGAHGKITHAETNSIIRTRKHKQPKHYISNSAEHTADRLTVPEDERILEFMMNALRLKQGFEISDFEARSGHGFVAISEKVNSLIGSGLLVQRAGRLQATTKGYRFLNTLLEEFL
ncbi:MAG: radical SAM family heme chaperone HemW [Pseudohongiellaceae bacterium]